MRLVYDHLHGASTHDGPGRRNTFPEDDDDYGAPQRRRTSVELPGFPVPAPPMRQSGRLKAHPATGVGALDGLDAYLVRLTRVA